MKKKNILLIMIMALFLVFTGCNGDSDGQVVDSPEETQEGQEKVDESAEKDLDNKILGEVYIEERDEGLTLYSQDIDIESLELVSVEYDEDKDNFPGKDLLKSEKDIKAGEKTTWDVVYSEGIPSMKLVWKLENGRSGEYLISYNGKYGRNPDKKIIYYANGQVLREYEKMEEDENLEEVEEAGKEKTQLKEVKLYFMKFTDTDAYLVEEKHKIENVEGIARLTLETLRDIKPKTEGAFNPMHPSTMFNTIYVKDNIMVVDFSKDIEKNSFGSSGEVLEVQAIVNTLTQFPTVEGVKFKIDGNEDIESWLSHIGTPEDPFEEDMSLVK